MSSFITNFFPSKGDKHENILPVPPPPLHTRSSQNEGVSERPSTPIRHNFINPMHTPQGSPSKNRNPPGAIDLPVAFENAMKLTPIPLGSPTKLGRQQGNGAPLALSKNNILPIDDSYFGNGAGNTEEAVLHKSAISPGSPLRKQGKENTPPTSRAGFEVQSQNQAAISRQEPYQSRERTSTAVKYNTHRGLTPEELEILHKPNVKRLANVTQLCKLTREDGYVNLVLKNPQTSWIIILTSLHTLDRARNDLVTSKLNIHPLRKPHRKCMVLCGTSILDESVRILGSVAFVFDKGISRS